MGSLNSLPVRVPIGQMVDAQGVQRPVMMTPEFARYMDDLLVRVGGDSGNSTTDIEALTLESAIAQPAMVDDSQIPETPPQVVILMAEISSLKDQVQLLMQAIEGLRPAPCACADVEQLVYASVGASASVDWESPGKIGARRPNTGSFTTLAASGQITSTVAAGTAPFVVASNFVVANLNSSLLLGNSWAAPGAIGATTPGAGAFTTLSATGQITSTVAGGTAPFVVASSTVVANLNVSQLLGATWVSPGAIGSTTKNSGAFTALSCTTGGAFAAVSTSAVISLSRTTTSAGTGYLGADATYAIRGFNSALGDVLIVAQNATPLSVTSAGISTSGSVVAGTGFGCNGKTAQSAAVSGGTLAGVITALVANGILSS